MSCTGHGESIIKICLAKHIICLMENGRIIFQSSKLKILSPLNTINCCLGMLAQNAVEQSLRLMNSKVKGAGGAICINAFGEAAFRFTTERMAWAIAKADVLSWGLDPNERNTEKMV